MKMKFNINLNSKHVHIILTYVIKSFHKGSCKTSTRRLCKVKLCKWYVKDWINILKLAAKGKSY